jgi:mannose-6-phosphate isomerase-like protein (cupin superfamily)
MHKINTKDIAEMSWSSPKGKFGGAGKEVSEALGRKPESMDINERHPFDVEILRIPPGKIPYPYHSHSAQWEFYHVISGTGIVRHEAGMTPIEAGDAFIFRPGQAHQITNASAGGAVDTHLPEWPLPWVAIINFAYAIAIIVTLCARRFSPEAGRALTRVLNWALLPAVPGGTLVGLYGLLRANRESR